MISLSSASRARAASFTSALVVASVAAWALTQGAFVLAAAAIAGVVLSAMSVVWLNRTSRSLDKAIAALADAADGKLRSRVRGIRGTGNISKMLCNINRVMDQMEAFSKETHAAMEAASEGRFYRMIQQRGLRGDFARFAGSVNATLASMAEKSRLLASFEGRMLKDAVAITMTVNEGAIANGKISGRIANAAHEAQSMAAATEEMVAGIQEISHNSEDASQLSIRAQGLTDDTRQVVQGAMTEFASIEEAVGDAARRVEMLGKASEAIGEVVTLINDIAGQTNLLALNATIEAARAGDAGKGFAVVANEVKNLSNQTAKATGDIANRVANLRQEMAGIITTMNRGTSAIANGREAMQSMSGRMAEVSNIVAEATGRMADISQVLGQQATAANEISGGVQKMAAQAKDNADAIEVSSKALTGIETEMGSLLTTLADRDIPHKVVMLAKADHVIWKKRLTDMLNGKATLSADELSTEKNCRLGKWCTGSGSSPYRDNPAFRDLEEPHHTVHQSGIEAVRAYNAGNIDEAIRLIEVVEQASVRVLSSLDRLMA